MQAKHIMQALTISLAAALAGCSTGPVPNIVSGGDATLPAGEESPAFLDRVSSEIRVTQNDAMRAVLLLMDDKDETATFADRVNKLLERKVVDPSWTFEAARPVTKGELGYMMYQALSLRGGVILMVAGPSQRYCLREMQYLGFISAGLMTTDISGGELVAVLARADNYKTTGRIPEIMKTSTAQ